MRPGKEFFQGVACSLEAKPAPSGANGNTVDQYRLKPLQREVVRPIRELEAESQNGNPGMTTYWSEARFCGAALAARLSENSALEAQRLR
jgi:hypothetical protein